MFFFFNDTATTEIYTLSLHDALPIYERFARLMSDAGPASWEDDNFDVRFAFFGRTDRDIRLRILEGRRARMQERLSRAQQQLAASRERDTYTEELQRHGVESVEREVRWLSDLIAARSEEHTSELQSR